MSSWDDDVASLNAKLDPYRGSKFYPIPLRLEALSLVRLRGAHYTSLALGIQRVTIERWVVDPFSKKTGKKRRPPAVLPAVLLKEAALLRPLLVDLRKSTPELRQRVATFTAACVATSNAQHREIAALLGMEACTVSLWLRRSTWYRRELVRNYSPSTVVR